MKDNQTKNITLYYRVEAYYGVSLHIWDCSKENGDDKDTFANTLKKAIKEEEWLQKNIDIGDALDFIDCLLNNLNGDDLYKNVINNFLFIDNLLHKAYEMDLHDSFQKIVHINRHPYSDSETVSIFGKFTPYLKNKEEFEKYFLNELESQDVDLYLSLIDDETAKEKIIAYKRKLIEQTEKNVDYYKKQMIEHKTKLEQLKKEISKIKGGKQ